MQTVSGYRAECVLGKGLTLITLNNPHRYQSIALLGQYDNLRPFRALKKSKVSQKLYFEVSIGPLAMRTVTEYSAV